MIAINSKANIKKSKDLTKDLLVELDQKKIARRLEYIYKQVPSMPACDQCAKCCFMSAEVYYIEYLNILSYLKTLSKKKRDDLAVKMLQHELLNLTSFDYKCPFLDNSKCTIYEYRPIACRIFGVYPEADYKKSREKGKKANIALAKDYRTHYSINLPKDVVAYDIDQCGNNIDEGGKKVVLDILERSRIRKMITELEKEIAPEYMNDKMGESSSFTNWFVRSFLSEIELHNMKLAVIRMYGEDRLSDVVFDNIISQYKIKI